MKQRRRSEKKNCNRLKCRCGISAQITTKKLYANLYGFPFFLEFIILYLWQNSNRFGFRCWGWWWRWFKRTKNNNNNNELVILSCFEWNKENKIVRLSFEWSNYSDGDDSASTMLMLLLNWNCFRVTLYSNVYLQSLIHMDLFVCVCMPTTARIDLHSLA